MAILVVSYPRVGISFWQLGQVIAPVLDSYDRTVSIPLSAKLTDEDVNDVIEAVKEIIC